MHTTEKLPSFRSKAGLPLHPAYVHFDLVSLLQEVTQATRESIGKKRVTVMDAASPGPVVISSDREMVRRILTELMDNAAKFTDRGRIALILNSEKDNIRLTVTDTGRGMKAEEVSAMIGADHNNDKQDDAVPGIGIRIKALGGTLTVSSKVGQGTIIEIILPSADHILKLPDTDKSKQIKLYEVHP